MSRSGMNHRTGHPAARAAATIAQVRTDVNPLNAELNPICHFLELLAHHILHVSGVRVKGVRSCEIGLTYKLSERSQAFPYGLGFVGEK